MFSSLSPKYSLLSLGIYPRRYIVLKQNKEHSAVTEPHKESVRKHSSSSYGSRNTPIKYSAVPGSILSHSTAHPSDLHCCLTTPTLFPPLVLNQGTAAAARVHLNPLLSLREPWTLELKQQLTCPSGQWWQSLLQHSSWVCSQNWCK